MPGHLSIDSSDLERFAKDYSKVLPSSIKRETLTAGRMIARRLVKEVRARADLNLYRSGRLRKDLQDPSRMHAKEVGANTGIYIIDIFPRRTIYSYIQEFGGVVRGRPYLRIPLPGVSNKKIRESEFGLAPIRGRGGNLVLAKRKRGKKGRGKGIEPIFALRTKVVLKPRLGVAKTIRERGIPIAQEELGKAVQRIWRTRRKKTVRR